MTTKDDSLAIRTEGLSKTYKSLLGRQRVEALKELDLEVERGAVFAILGPNGAGKTTLVKTLLGIVAPTTGLASLFGTPIANPGARFKTGYLPEDHRFPAYLTAEKTLDFYGSLSRMPRRERRERIDAALDAVGLLKWKTVKTRKFSKGMKQRLGIAQAIFHQPDLIFLDEPTDGVDPLGRKAIRDLIIDLHRQGRTIFINSHLLSEVELICHRTVILHHGVKVREGTVEELTQSEGEYVFVTRGNVEPLEERLRGICLSYKATEEGFRATLKREEDVDGLVDVLRGASVGIRAITPVKISLEDMFIRILEKGEGGKP